MPRSSVVPPGVASEAVWPGEPFPLGATWDGGGVNFAIYSENASRIEVCLFEANGTETARHRLPETTAHVFHGYVPGLVPGQRYGYRVLGPWAPEEGHRFNPHKLLIDPYARALDGRFDPLGPVLGYRDGNDLVLDESDSSNAMPKAIVIDDAFPWGDDAPPRTPFHETILYELHVKGFTQRHPAVPPELRGKYAGLAHPAVIEHLHSLGVTAVELLPVHHSVTCGTLAGKGLTNYWGYDSLAFLAPDTRFAQRDAVREFKAMVKSLHAAGIEVILDVVYNHTCEGNHLGPTLSLKGIDNATYYRLVDGQRRWYMDYTGTGNTLNMLHPQALQLVMDSLRYWVTEMHVDGFRFDLASALARSAHGVDRLSGFFETIHQDPVLSRVKLIAEPWDAGEGGYQVGNFPLLWNEWNAKYRDAVRRFWNAAEPGIKELAYRLTGSSDLYQWDGRRPYTSINLVTTHDGFTLHDLVTYAQRRNEANGEDNRDGENDNHSTNGGVEGETDEPAVVRFRERQKRNLLATLFLSQGVPMLVAGDEMGRTQRGNNNAYCQDNEISWVDWQLDDRRSALLEFTRSLSAFRKSHPVLQRRRYFTGQNIGPHAKDLAWFRPDGVEMKAEDWDAPSRRFAFVVEDTLLVMVNGDPEDVIFKLPALEWAESWERAIDTEPGDHAAPVSLLRLAAGEPVAVPPLSISVFVGARRE
ncbi:MAG: glycogen debranching protein GlgX [Polyangiales bacterium]